MKKSLSIVLSAICTAGICLNFSACNDEKYQVSQEEYDQAFTKETLSNVTFCVSLGFTIMEKNTIIMLTMVLLCLDIVMICNILGFYMV